VRTDQMSLWRKQQQVVYLWKSRTYCYLLCIMSIAVLGTKAITLQSKLLVKCGQN